MTSAPIKHPDLLYIGGEWIAPSSSARIEVFNSGTEELFARVAEAQADDVDRAVAAARGAFDDGPWPRMTHGERARYIIAIARELDARGDDLARIWTTESGVLHSSALASAGACGHCFDQFAAMAETYPFEEVRQPTPGTGDYGIIVREPVGVVAAIVAWNGPMVQMAYKIAPALLSGCTVIVKPPADAPTSAYVFAEICEKIGLPAGVVNVLVADRAVSELLVRHPGVDKVAFTGSSAVGRKIAAICGESIARCTLELGGKSAAIILDDYDLDAAAASVSSRTVYLSGQACIATSRLIVPRRRHDEFVDALAARFGATLVGDPFDAATQMGPLATRHHRERVEGYIAKGKAEGARLATGGSRPQHLGRGWFVEPTVFGNVANDFTIAREEIFGPVLSVIAAEDEEDAIRIANDTIYGLAGVVFTNDPDRAYAVSRRIRTGMMGQNALRTDFALGFGGMKQSGLGREGGTEGLSAYLEMKTILMDERPSHVGPLPA
jgi:acyl-CoA reductase-like NAD-dependent aldehyde dehydrogenase